MKIKKTTLLLSLVLVVTMFPMSAFAASDSLASNKSVSSSDVTTIRNAQDLARMQERDIEEYNMKLDKIDSNLRNDFDQFVLNYDGAHPSTVLNSRSSAVTKLDNEELIDTFLESYPEYEKVDRATLSKDLIILRDNIVVEAVRAFFSLNGYDLSLSLFNHSLTDNPEPANMTLIGSTDGMYGYIKDLLQDDGFVDEMVDFSRDGTSYQTISNSSDYIFDDGDLYWAIHGFTWTRTRTLYDKAYFKIIDVYDFNKWQDIPGIVAGLADTHDFDIEVYGLVQDGEMQ